MSMQSQGKLSVTGSGLQELMGGGGVEGVGEGVEEGVVGVAYLVLDIVVEGLGEDVITSGLCGSQSFPKNG